MKQAFYIVSISGCIFLVNACSTQMYVSNAVNAPLLKEKNELQLVVATNNLQAAAAIGNNVGIIANGFYQTYSAGNNYKQSGMMGEFGMGYFKSLPHNFVFETFVGGGVGRVDKQQEFTDVNDAPFLASYNANATKGFIQPDIGYKSRFFDVVVSSRFSCVKYSSFSPQNYPTAELQKDYLDNNSLTGPVFLFAEPALTLRAGYKCVKLQAQYGLTINATGNNIRHGNNFSSLGVVIDIARWYREEKKVVTLPAQL